MESRRLSPLPSERRGPLWAVCLGFAAFLLGAGSCDAPMGMPDGGTPMPDLACTMCAGTCVDVSADPNHCGGCGAACSPAQKCVAGRCEPPGMTTDMSGSRDMAMTMLDFGPPRDLAMPADMAMTMPPRHLCDATPPAGAKLAPPPPTYAGTCPMLVSGKNTIVSSGVSRTFLLAIPAGLMPSEKLPVVFMWHWLGGSADAFRSKGQVQAAVDGQRFLAILPESKGDIVWKWPFDALQSNARMEEEYRFFDDMLACAAEQFNVNNNCVSSVGVSAGALFTSQLASGRAKTLASALVLSGGVGGIARPWTTAPRKIPMLVLWGGAMDNCLGLVNFQTSSKALETALVKDGHFLLECVHNCGHAEPPLEAPMMLSKYAAFWEFVFAHPYWLNTGDSPYKMAGLPPTFPSWCSIGMGSATPRTGMCPDKPGC
jgi:predicted esterase